LGCPLVSVFKAARQTGRGVVIGMVRMAARIIQIGRYHKSETSALKISEIRRNYRLGREDGIDLPQQLRSLATQRGPSSSSPVNGRSGA
jgi:hypothetical protein